MPQVGFEPMMRVFERVKRVHALYCAAIVIGILLYTVPKKSLILGLLPLEFSDFALGNKPCRNLRIF
jgi:hypothetical protein